ncbi:M20 family metallopeptidase [Streptomyces sp. NPDC091377]|uniref:M20 family metallopeptidase n=1 Tax=Streptomyces sp. NPDC091377 TaxID=3365995 RepID=UPI003812204D
MTDTTEVTELTRRLVAVPTVDADESAAQAVVAPLLERAGFTVRSHEHAPGRATLIAEWRTDLEAPPLCLSGHLDTVPLGAAPWQHDPYAGEPDGDRLHGRGTSDMKGGVAAMVLAAVRATAHRPRRAGLRLVLTAAEETGALGAHHVAPLLRGGCSGPLLIAEPTANQVVHGHKGALWLQARTTGITAHGSMPHLGDNAAYKLAHAVVRLADFAFPDTAHPVMGRPTLNVGTLSAGLNPNSVPDLATATVDVRTVAGQDHTEVLALLADRAGPEVDWEPLVDLPPVWTDPADEWARALGEIVTAVAPGIPYEPRTATFFTDAAVLAPALGAPPALICGPGEPSQAHATDEWCSIRRLEESLAIYERVVASWCGL